MSVDPFRPPQGKYDTLGWDDIDPRRARLFHEFNDCLRARLKATETEREGRWERDFSSLEAYERSIAPNRQRWLGFLTAWDEPRCDLAPRVEHVADYEAFRLDRVWLQVRTDLEMDALLLTPHGARKAAAVVCQHGMDGTPEQACGFNPGKNSNVYNYAGIRLAEMGFVVIAPHEVGGYGSLEPSERYLPGMARESRYQARNYLHRLASLLAVNLMGMDLYHVSRSIDYLCGLDTVDPERIGMYGLSQGGLSALWLPAADTRIKVSVSSAFFDHRLPNLVDSGGDNYVSYIDAPEEDRFYWGQMLEFSDWQIASLICPRAFMVEIGKQDKATYWRSALEEFARVQAVYDRLGIGDRAEFCLHEDGHLNRAVESLAFLRKWLRLE